MIDGHRTLQVEAAAQREALKDRVFVDELMPLGWRKMENTIPETNIAPENRPLEKEIPIGNHHF